MAALPAPALAAPAAGAGPSAALVASEIDRAVHPSGIVPVLQNIVATVNLDCALDLKSIALHARNAEYNPKVRALRQVPQPCLCISGHCSFGFP